MHVLFLQNTLIALTLIIILLILWNLIFIALFNILFCFFLLIYSLLIIFIDIMDHLSCKLLCVRWIHFYCVLLTRLNIIYPRFIKTSFRWKIAICWWNQQRCLVWGFAVLAAEACETRNFRYLRLSLKNWPIVVHLICIMMSKKIIVIFQNLLSYHGIF